ncbi:MAG: hypothetical protein EOM26_05165 [Alphaproteobacteria bacterium]|nr:hypothetical protein [Alphaproteobacteria bacterium]
MRPLQILLVVLALIPAGVLAHDVYRWYETVQEKPNEPFTLSEIGFLWVTYDRSSHDSAVREVGKETWDETVRPIMRMPAVVVTAVPPLLVAVLMGVLWLFGGWPFNRLKGGAKVSKSDFAATAHRQKTFSYKRK